MSSFQSDKSMELNGGEYRRAHRHHFQLHDLPPVNLNDVLLTLGATTVSEGLRVIKNKKPVELRAIFESIYKKKTRSQNKRWLQRRLAEALRVPPSQYFPLFGKVRIGSGEEPAASNESLETTCTDSPSLSPKSILKENQFETGFIASARFEDQERDQQTCFPSRSMSTANQSEQPTAVGTGNSEHYVDIKPSPLLLLNSDDGCGIDAWSQQIDRSVHGWDASESSFIPPLLLSLSFTIQEEISNYLSNDTISHLGSNATLLPDDLSNVVMLPTSHSQSVLNTTLLEDCIWS